MLNPDYQPTALVTKVAVTRPIAQKEYRCTICDQVIPKGQRHERLVYRDDDSLNPKRNLRFLRIHLTCPPNQGSY